MEWVLGGCRVLGVWWVGVACMDQPKAPIINCMLHMLRPLPIVRNSSTSQARKGQQFKESAKKLRKAENLEPIQNLGTLGTWETGIVSEHYPISLELWNSRT